MAANLFISHASEDKASVAKPLADALIGLGFGVWFDEYSLNVGDGLRASIDLGLAKCDYGIVVLSEYFLSKNGHRMNLERFSQWNPLMGRIEYCQSSTVLAHLH
jgi:hypothetical protein